MRCRRILLFFLIIMLGIMHIEAKEVEIYKEEGLDQTLEQMRAEWVSNNDRVFIFTGIMDGEKTKKYLGYSNQYSDSEIVKSSSNKRHLADGEYLKININNLDIDSSQYQDIRLFINYGESIASDDLTKEYGLKVYAIDTSNKKHGPFYLGDYESTGYYKRDSEETYIRTYYLITNSLKEKNNYKIKSLEIIPYGNLPRLCNTSKSLPGDWRCQVAVFYVSEIKIIGYKNETYKNKNVTYEKINVNKTRLNIAKRMYDLATIKWTPSMDMSSIRIVNGLRFATDSNGNIKYIYKKGEYYYGPPYTQVNRLLPEQFYNILQNKKMPTLYEKDAKGNNVQSKDTWGDDCSASVSYSVSKYLPLTSMYNTSDFIWDRRKTTLLGGLNVRSEAEATDSVYSDLYSKYLNNPGTSSLKETISTFMNQRLKSNDQRMWVLGYKSSDVLINRAIGYTEMKSTSDKPAIDSDEQLKLYVENLNISSNKEVEIKFKYYININKNGSSYDENLKKENIIVRLCDSSNKCNDLTDVTLSNLEVLNSDYKIQTVTVKGTSTSNITKVYIIPYGNEAKKSRVFRLAELAIKVSGTNYYKVTAYQMTDYLDIKNNITEGLIAPSYVRKINGSFTTNETKDLIAKFLARQDIYNGYKELKIGDIVSSHYTKTTHVRLITGNTQVECFDGTKLITSNSGINSPKGNCDSNGGINGERSYYIRTDINSSSSVLTEENKNNFGAYINSTDYVAPWTPNSNYTDLKSGDIKGIKRNGSNTLFLMGKNLNYYINFKNTFEEGLLTAYLPITFNDYKTGKVEKPYVTLINGNTLKNVKNGLKGSIYSNYPIIRLIINLEYTNKGKTLTKQYKIYPNHSNSSKENAFVNNYSLYYNTPEDIQKSIKSILASASEYELKVMVDAGTASNMEAIKLSTKKETVKKDPDEQEKIIDLPQETVETIETTQNKFFDKIDYKIVAIISLIVILAIATIAKIIHFRKNQNVNNNQDYFDNENMNQNDFNSQNNVDMNQNNFGIQNNQNINQNGLNNYNNSDINHNNYNDQNNH